MAEIYLRKKSLYNIEKRSKEPMYLLKAIKLDLFNAILKF